MKPKHHTPGYLKLCNAWAYLAATYWMPLSPAEREASEVNDALKLIVDCARAVRKANA